MYESENEFIHIVIGKKVDIFLLVSNNQNYEEYYFSNYMVDVQEHGI